MQLCLLNSCVLNHADTMVTMPTSESLKDATNWHIWSPYTEQSNHIMIPIMIIISSYGLHISFA